MCDWPVSASKSVFSPEKLWGKLQLYTQGIEVDLSFPPLASEEYARFFPVGYVLRPPTIFKVLNDVGLACLRYVISPL